MEKSQRKISKTEEKTRTNLEITCEKILLWLDVKSLMRFKCVCSRWGKLISRSSFIHNQMEISATDPEQNHHQIFLIYPLTTIDYKYFGFHVEGGWNKIIDKPLRYPRELSWRYMEIVGSCDGLICLLTGVKQKDIIWNPSTCEEKNIKLWNPSTTELVTLPLPFDDYDIGFYWFGHDSDSKGYKILISSHYNKYHEIYEFGLIDGSYDWRKCKNGIICLTRVFEKRGNFFNGKVHWPCLQNKPRVVSYDLSKAKLKVISAPNVIQRTDSCFTLGVLGGCLCTICKPGEKFEIWMMKECSLEQFWSRLTELEGFKIGSKFLRILGTLRNSDLIVEVDHMTLERYYFNGMTPRIVKTYPVSDEHFILTDAITYVESLVSPIHTIQLSAELLRIKEEAALNECLV